MKNLQLKADGHYYIGEYRAYPIYAISASWVEDGVQNPEYPNRHKGLPEGRIHDSTSFRKMYPQKQVNEYVWNSANQWWIAYRQQMINDGKNPSLIKLSCELKLWETWKCTWFGHNTFDIGLSDSEVLKSFEEYVRRYEHMQDMSIDYINSLGETYICLMGAEDRYRWRAGFNLEGERDDDVAAPCRCIHCKKNGMISIAH